MRRGAALWVAVVLLVAACGGDAATQVTTSVPGSVSSSSIPSSTIAAGGSRIAEMQQMVMGPGGAPEGTEPNPGESGAVTIELFPDGSEFRDMFERHGAIEAFGAVFTSPSGDRTVVNAAVRFATAEGAQAAVEEVQAGGVSFLASASAVLALAAGRATPNVLDCARFTHLERTEDVVHVWVDTSACVPDGDTPAHMVRLVCPDALAPGDTAVVTVRSPQHFAPFEWQAEESSLAWSSEGPLEVGPGPAGIEVTGVVTAGEVADGESETAQASVEFEIFTELQLWEPYRATGGIVAADCEIEIVGAEPLAIAGTWSFSVNVVGATGECDDEGVYVEEYTITQDGTSIAVSGLLGQVDAWVGSVAGDRVQFSGTRAEDEGLTAATFVMTIIDDETMVGTEDWSWTDPDGDLVCPSGFSEVTATRIGG